MKTREIPSIMLNQAQHAVLQYGLPMEVIRARFMQFRSNADAVAKARGTMKLRSAFKEADSGKSLLRFLEGEYVTSYSDDVKRNENVRVLKGGKMQYRQKSRWVNAYNNFQWSIKYKSISIIGAAGSWRLDMSRSTDNNIVWTNVNKKQQTIIYKRLNVRRCLEL